MKILLINDEVWNDDINGNNVLSNWFDGFQAEFADVYASPGLPKNNCCMKYFQLTDSMMIKSIFKNIPAGRILTDADKYVKTKDKYNSTDVGKIDFLRKWLPNLLRSFKTFVWNFGKYNKDELKKFVLEFNPDIIFSLRFANSKILRLENEILKYANCPIVAFTGDNEYSLRRFEFSPVFWMNLFYQRYVLRKNMNKYSMYYTLSKRQIEELQKHFKIPMKTLMKCGEFSDASKDKPIGNPIKIIYAGKLYMNRWKTIAAIGKCLKEINKNETKMILEIYTRDNLSKKQKKLLNDNKNIFIMGGVAPEILKEKYKEADIALHVESFNLKARYATRVSFSTKIIDCLDSSCAVMAIAWKEHTGLEYLKSKDAAICIDNIRDLKSKLLEITNNKNIIKEYRDKALKCGLENHKRDNIQKMLYNDFKEIIDESCSD